MSLGENTGSCDVMGGALSSLVADGWGFDPNQISFWPGASQPRWVGLGFFKMALLKKHTLIIIPETFAFNSFPHDEQQSTPVFPGGTIRTVVRSDPDSYRVSGFPWDPVHMKACVCLSRMGSPFLSVLWSFCAQAPLAFNAKCFQGSFIQ